MRSAKFESINLLDFVRGFAVTKSSVGKRGIEEKGIPHIFSVFFDILNISIYCGRKVVVNNTCY